MPDLRTHRLKDGYTIQEWSLLQALQLQANSGMLLTNPRVTGFPSFTKAVRFHFKLDDDKKAPKTCKKLYAYLKQKGYYNGRPNTTSDNTHTNGEQSQEARATEERTADSI
tara:strand:+ start:407 stop:739 length:333 start_codon:yes stop_codon:yes gene_type:complete